MKRKPKVQLAEKYDAPERKIYFEFDYELDENGAIQYDWQIAACFNADIIAEALQNILLNIQFLDDELDERIEIDLKKDPQTATIEDYKTVLRDWMGGWASALLSQVGEDLENLEMPKLDYLAPTQLVCDTEGNARLAKAEEAAELSLLRKSRQLAVKKTRKKDVKK